MPLGSLSSVLEVKSAEGFKGSFVLASSLPVNGTASGAAPTPPAPDGVLLSSAGDYLVTSTGDNLAFA